MSLPFFYVHELNDQTIQLDEDTSKHIINVLRMSKGEPLLLTDGFGKKAEAVILDDNRKKCIVRTYKTITEEKPKPSIYIGISLIKNSSRFEWFLEKAAEIGVGGIIPLLCERTEKEKFRIDRMQHILTSAMLQSQQCWLTFLHEPREFKSVVIENTYDVKLIGHCMESEKKDLSTLLPNLVTSSITSCIILIGPEGDFSQNEITFSINKGFNPVSLGNTRLRTETAGMVAAAMLCSVRS
jgi:16S rRNA (uracil1498-N3)-methyltransferase